MKIKTNVVGVTKDGRQRLLSDMIDDDSEIIIDRDPDNKFDPDAIGVYLIDGDDEYSLGFLSRDLAGKLAPMLDEGHTLVVLDHERTGGMDDLNFGLNLTLDLSDEPGSRSATSSSGNRIAMIVGWVVGLSVMALFAYGLWAVYGLMDAIFDR